MLKFTSICYLLSAFVLVASTVDERKLYIAYMGSLPEGKYLPSLHHAEIVSRIIDPRFANKSLIRSFKRSFNGFAAYLSEQERDKLSSVDGIRSVFPSQKLQLQTTRSWDFMGFTRRAERRPVVESDIIIGVIDGGIWPESVSFNDEGFGAVPNKWKGECAGGKNFSCNKKIIGARCYSLISLDCSARDDHGHGTHVASIAAGNEVIGANYYGLAAGVARGGVPSARLAVYKICEFGFCDTTDILTAFDDAIADGVDIISLSIGLKHPVELNSDLDSDPISIGSFHAIEKEVLTVHSAGNFGPDPFTVTNAAPWILAVGGSYTDRRIIDKVLLGDGKILEGDSIHAFSSSPSEVPLVYGKEVTQTCSETEARNCSPWCFESSMIKQKVVLCDTRDIKHATIEPGALGYLIPNDGHQNVSTVTPSPIAALSANNMYSLKAYKYSTKMPLVRIIRSEAVKRPTTPLVAPFSSRGPAISIPDIVKPDVTAPGVEIFAAFSEMAPPSEFAYDKRPTKFNIMSGTSMACPHVSGAAAFVKSFHPNWSASAIKSALMTTAWEMNASQNKEVEFAYGSGHIDPVKATDPGLVYETLREDYLKIWCSLSANNTSCPEKLTPKELNYPSMAAKVETTSDFVVTFPRTVTNVGRANSRYVASIKGCSKLHISVEPNTLQFTFKNQKLSFVVTVKGKLKSSRILENAALVWTDTIHEVRSPIVVYNVNATSRVVAVSPPTWFSQIYVILVLIVLVY